MEKKRQIELAAEMLRNSHGYANGQHSVSTFDFKLDEDKEGIEVFQIGDNETFYWPERIVEISNALHLSCYVSVTHRYDNPRVVMRVY